MAIRHTKVAVADVNKVNCADWNSDHTITSPFTTAEGGTGLAVYGVGDMLYYAAGATLSKLGIAINKCLMMSDGTKPTWQQHVNTSPNQFTCGQLMAEKGAAGSNVSVTAQNIAARQAGNAADLYAVLNQNSQDIFAWRHKQITAADNDTRFYLEIPNGSNAITILRDGKVGIGADPPTQALDLFGDMIVHPDAVWSAGDVATIYLGATTSSYIKNTFGTGLEIFIGDNMFFKKSNAAGDKFYWQKADSTILLTLDNDGDLTIVGELEGARENFPLGDNSSYPVLTNFYLKTINGVVTSATRGYVMHRPGSIVGLSFQGLVSMHLGGTATIEVRKNGVAVYSLSFTPGGNGVKAVYGTQARGTDTFVAGDVFTIYYNSAPTSDWTIEDVIAYFEVVFNT